MTRLEWFKDKVDKVPILWEIEKTIHSTVWWIKSTNY